RLVEIKPYLEKRFEVYHGAVDLYAYFFERGVRILKSNGRLGYITSCSFFKTSSGSRLKDFLRSKSQLEVVLDFGDNKVFDGVTTYPAVLVVRRGPPSSSHQISFWNLDEIPETNFSEAFRNNCLFYPQVSLTVGSWEFE